jgi:CRP-like cAMP-binding protein
MFDSLATYLTEKGSLTPEEVWQVEQVVIPRKIRKHQYLLQAGAISNYIGFVVKGCLRQFRISENGQEHIMRFAIENWWVSDFESFLSGQPSKSYIDALEDSEIIMMEKENYDTLIRTIPNFKSLIEKLTAKNFEVHQARIYSNISESAEERYNNFIKSYPSINQRVPLHMVASFLGLSRETLSRVRKQDSRKNTD